MILKYLLTVDKEQIFLAQLHQLPSCTEAKKVLKATRYSSNTWVM